MIFESNIPPLIFIHIIKKNDSGKPVVKGRNYVRENVEDRSILLGQYMVEHQTTVRSTAKQFGISKSTVHKDITERLRKANHSLYLEVKQVLDMNKKERHIRGGMATREKYLLQHQREQQNAAHT